MPDYLQLRRIALYLGIPDPEPAPAHRAKSPASIDDMLREAAQAGIPIVEGRPDDPMLDLLDA